jgi:hypothetical protein
MASHFFNSFVEHINACSKVSNNSADFRNINPNYSESMRRGSRKNIEGGEIENAFKIYRLYKGI